MGYPRAMPAQKGKSQGVLIAIAIFKLVKGTMLLVVAAATFGLLHHDTAERVRSFARHLHVDPEGKFVGLVIEKVSGVSERKLEAIAVGTIFYATLFFTEGVGLVLRKYWAEWMTMILTASFVPIEIYELVHHFTPMKIVIIVLNLAMVGYLAWRVRGEHAERKATKRHAAHAS